MEWIDCNVGSKVTMKYPSVYLTGEGAKEKFFQLHFAGPGQHQDAGAKNVSPRSQQYHRVLFQSQFLKEKDVHRIEVWLWFIQMHITRKSLYHAMHSYLMRELRTDTYPFMKIKSDFCNCPT